MATPYPSPVVFLPGPPVIHPPAARPKPPPNYRPDPPTFREPEIPVKPGYPEVPGGSGIRPPNIPPVKPVSPNPAEVSDYNLNNQNPFIVPTSKVPERDSYQIYNAVKQKFERLKTQAKNWKQENEEAFAFLKEMALELIKSLFRDQSDNCSTDRIPSIINEAAKDIFKQIIQRKPELNNVIGGTAGKIVAQAYISSNCPVEVESYISNSASSSSESSPSSPRSNSSTSDSPGSGSSGSTSTSSSSRLNLRNMLLIFILLFALIGI